MKLQNIQIKFELDFEKELQPYWDKLMNKNRRKLIEISKVIKLKNDDVLNHDYSSQIRELCLIFETEIRERIFFDIIKKTKYKKYIKKILEEELDRSAIYKTNTDLLKYLITKKQYLSFLNMDSMDRTFKFYRIWHEELKNDLNEYSIIFNFEKYNGTQINISNFYNKLHNIKSKYRNPLSHTSNEMNNFEFYQCKDLIITTLKLMYKAIYGENPKPMGV